MRIKELIAILRSFDYYTDSPCQYKRKSIDESSENIDSDVRV